VDVIALAHRQYVVHRAAHQRVRELDWILGEENLEPPESRRDLSCVRLGDAR
jgi:hypothetical protein